MRFIFVSVAVIMLGVAGAQILERTYLPPQYNTISRPQFTGLRPQNVYLPPAAAYRQTSYVAPSYRQTSYVAPSYHQTSIPETTYISPAVHQSQYISRPQVIRPQNVYLPPAVVQRPVYRPSVQLINQAQYSPSRTYLPPQDQHYDIDVRGQF